MPKLTPTRLIASRHAATMVDELYKQFPKADTWQMKHIQDCRAVITNFFIKAINADRAEKRRFQRQKDRVIADAQEVLKWKNKAP